MVEFLITQKYNIKLINHYLLYGIGIMMNEIFHSFIYKWNNIDIFEWTEVDGLYLLYITYRKLF